MTPGDHGRETWLPAALGAILLALWAAPAHAADPLNLLDYAPAGTKLDRTGHEDASPALAAVIAAANVFTAKGEPACVYVPPGTYRIVSNPPAFKRAGCVRGEGPTQSTLLLDERFHGDLFAWSEAWIPTTPGPTVVGLRVLGNRKASEAQNALVFYDRTDEVHLENLDISELPGRAIYTGVSRDVPDAYMRESRMRGLRLFNDGAPGLPVLELGSKGHTKTDATDEIRLSDIDIYGARGPSLVIRSDGGGSVRDIVIDGLRIEGTENGSTRADLLTIGDPVMNGNVNNVRISGLELIDPYPDHAALRLTAPRPELAPYHIHVAGFIGGGLSRGQGLRIDAGRSSQFLFEDIHTDGTNVVIGAGAHDIVLDGGGAERAWTYAIDPSSRAAVFSPLRKETLGAR